MDSGELLATLKRRIAESARDRDRLAEAVAALDDEVSSLQDEAETLAGLILRYAGADEPEAAPTVSAPDRLDAEAFSISWPAGPEHDKPIKTRKPRAWAKYKMNAADWYLNALLATSLHGDRLERTVGVEMAIEGVIQSLCGAFEAMIYTLSNSIEKLAGVAAELRTPRHLVTWGRLAGAAKVFDIDLASTLSISSAMLGEDSENPEGSLAQLFVLRRRVALQDLLVDHHRTDGDVELRIDVPGRGPLPLLDYLFESRSTVEELLETISHDVEDAKAGRLYIPGADELRARAEKGLGALLAPDDLLAS
jgi:hypothetical protein